MPVKRRLERTRAPGADELIRLLHNEWSNPKKSGQPLIIIEGKAKEPLHVYVIWDQWGERNQTERSEIIMDVVDNLAGEHRLPVDSPVTVAMGLTPEEAARMGIRHTVGRRGPQSSDRGRT
jgi:hypothetical protein